MVKKRHISFANNIIIFLRKQHHFSLCSTSRSEELPISNEKTSASAPSSLLVISCAPLDKYMRTVRRSFIDIQNMRWARRLTKYGGRMVGSREKGTNRRTQRLRGSPTGRCRSLWRGWEAPCRNNISSCSDCRQKPWRETKENGKSRSRSSCRRRR